MNSSILFIGLYLGQLTITSYRSIPSQTDSSPYYTSIGERTHKGGVAVSRDLLKRWDGPLDYGDYIFIERFGIYQINDCMNTTQYDKIHHKKIFIRKHIDIWVETYNEEKNIGVKNLKVYLLRRK